MFCCLKYCQNYHIVSSSQFQFQPFSNSPLQQILMQYKIDRHRNITTYRTAKRIFSGAKAPVINGLYRSTVKGIVTAAALEAAFDFMEQAFAESQEMVVFVTELTVNPASHQFLTENGCERYFKYNKDLLLDHRKAALQQELAAEQRRHGGV